MSTFSKSDRIPSAWDAVGAFGSPSFVYKADVDITECDLRWCAKTFRYVKVASITSSPYSISGLTHKKVNGTMADYSVNETDLWKEESLSTTGYTSSIPDQYFVMHASDGNAASIPPEQDFTVGLIDGYPIKLFLRDFFDFTLTEYMTTREPSAFNTGLSLLTRAGGTSATVAAIAHALTLQTLVGPNSTRHAGTAFAPEIYVEVRWPWIVFPALLLGAGAAFLAASVAVGRRKQGRGWKAGLMPLLFHGVSGWDGDAVVGRIEGRQEMDSVAREVQARLMRDDAGNLRFVKAKAE
ncbi:hypothetical protein BFW01_g970 [Lasiodiplodia theobromae]|uniref:Uncharacterized protein n=1 Tax=Lasiodiplodia theobromae TaxID=45133 RepID=A0A8H7IR31_9PEZI|nr:hypothetical protein BFW01_g970 [Lasiodiplodia theobromae]